MPVDKMASFSALASWRTLAIVFALINLKSLPLSWHVRIFYRMFSSWYTPAHVKRAIQSSSTSNKTHPLFQPVSIFSRSPLLETDYNLHKSNSTYFADLDESRSALMTKFLTPNSKQGVKNLEKEGHKGRTGVILGSVHTSFHREIKPYERYEVRSRVLGWDKKWIVIGSWFIRPARKGKEEVVLASSLSKYVVKKGRFTVAPERCLTTAGWLPAKPENSKSRAGQQANSSEGSEKATQMSTTESYTVPSGVDTPDGLPAPVPEQAVEATTAIVEKLESLAEKTSRQQVDASEPLMPLTALDKAGEWDWHHVEMERVRGLRIAENWLALDKQLLEEYARG
ncbi:hypothetical protein EDD37DRAFT_410561 [Exophiala viscosa]|uniref:Thioesterase domain-containing protein n=1 Tax=Exophiala viscosa TaxID=2486360 RepID=A0AAN6E062_9EURO|nr:hypothetical protein EDD36DRAFT_431234 [Exophiala viscosa]KAI1624386.1 hypothetical protein EDD37DRAFT_410561 [Exophiala viscosa]